MKRRFDYDFVRFWAMCMVVLFHISSAYSTYNITSPISVLYAGKNVTLGQFGVVLFFIVSGATSCMSMRSALNKGTFRQAVGTYYKKRLLAMMPAFYIAYLIVYVLYGAHTLSGLLQPKMLYTLFGMDGYASIGGISTCYEIGEWFLGAILLLYLVFPLLYWLIRKYPKQTFVVLLIGFILLVRLYPFTVRPMDGNFLVRIFDFSLGIYIGTYFENKIDWKIGLGGAALMLVVMFVQIPVLYYEFCITLQGIGAFFFLMMVGKWLQGLPFITTNYIQTVASAGSNYCYEIFLVHHIVILEFLAIFCNVPFGFKTWVLTTLAIVGLIVFWAIIIRMIDKYIKEICGTITKSLKKHN